MERRHQLVSESDLDWNDEEFLSSPDPTVSRALALMHSGEHSEALDLTETLVSSGDKGIDALSARAYALARNGRVDEARAITLALLPQLPALDQYNQCELLHLLGDVEERSGRLELAIRYFLEERRLGSPASHRNLHNRDHLLGLLEREGREPSLRIAVASEGLALSREASSSDKISYFADRLARAALDEQDARAKSAALSVLESQPDLRTIRSVRYALAEKDLDVHGFESVEAELRELAEGKDSVAAWSSFLLAAHIEDTTQRQAILERAAELPGLYGTVCAALGLDALWKADRLDDLERMASRAVELDPTCSEAHAALARCAMERGELAQAQALFARAMCTAPTGYLTVDPQAFDAMFPPAFVEASFEETRQLLSAHVHCLLDSQMSECPLPGVSFNKALDRITFFHRESPEPDRQTISFLEDLSEEAWDRNRLDFAASARRHLCDLVRAHRGALLDVLASQLGWLATIVKQDGRFSEAEHLFQEAIEIGRASLEPSELASLTGRYGNLLHQIGNYRIAAVVQWRALASWCRIATPDALPTADEMRMAVESARPDASELVRFTLLCCNMTNCLIDSGEVDLSVVALAATQRLLALTAEHTSVGRDVDNLREVERLARVLPRKLEARLIGDA
jgi:tetratricopeptide (TPR) repeat protein